MVDLAQSAKELDFQGLFGFRPSLTSHHLNWNNLFAIISQSHVPDLEPIEVPAMSQDHLILHLANPVKITVYTGHKAVRANSLPGTFSTVPKGQPTKWHITGGRGKVLTMFLDHQLLHQFAIQTLDTDPSFLEVCRNVAVEDPLILHLGLAIRDELVTQGLAGQLYIDTLAQALAAHLFRKFTAFSKNPPRITGKLPASTLRDVLSYIEAHLTESLKLQDVAEVANLSAFHFARLFKETVGLPVYQYVLQKRMENGKQLLLSGDYNVSQAALRTGFADVSHFSRHFKRHFGISPGKLAKKQQENTIITQ